MSDLEPLQAELSQHLGRPFHIEKQRSIGGGCINDAFCIEDAKDRFFLKANKRSFLPAFEAEAEALKQIAATQTARVPEVIALVATTKQAYLVLEYVEMRSSRAGNWEELGRQLAGLHAHSPKRFGWQQDNFIGATPQPNPDSDDWIEFFRCARLEHILRLCSERGYRLPFANELLERLPEFFEDYAPQASLLHGDLWSGNVSFDPAGQPVLFDPASYWGDRETDLAFTEFFGGFSPEFYKSYQQTFPLHPGYQQRKTLYNLFHCLNHLYLFGASYANQAEQMTRQLLD